MDRVNYYQTQIAEYSIERKKSKFRRNVVTILKLISFGVFIYTIYLWLATTFFLTFYCMGISVILFIVLSVIDVRLVGKLNILDELIQIQQAEIAYNKGDLSSFDTGKEFLSTTHPYSYDLDIFGESSIFQSINRTVTIGGKKIVASYLSHPSTDAKEIEDRQKAVAELKEDIAWGHHFRATGTVNPTTNYENHIIEKWQKTTNFVSKKWVVYLIYLANIVTIASWVIAAFDLIPYNIPRILSLLQLITSLLLTNRLNKQHSNLNQFIKAIGNYFYLVKLIDSKEFQSNRLTTLKSRLSGKNGALKGLSSLNKILSKLDQRSNVLVTIFLDSLYMKNIHHMIELDKWKGQYINDIDKWIDSVNQFDTFVSMSNYSYNHSDFTIPVIDCSKIVDCKDLGHPLIKRDSMVYNDFRMDHLHNIFIITGANMAGKSTFLRAVGVNMVLALSGNVVCSKEFRFTPIELFTSMRTTDNLAKGTSYFHAELLRLKELTNKALDGAPLFIILDEMLKGTNSEDKLNGSIKFLKRLLTLPVCGLVATHDLALGDLSKEYRDHFYNYCFEIDHKGRDIIYDYKLKSGVSKNMNASILLEQMGLI